MVAKILIGTDDDLGDDDLGDIVDVYVFDVRLAQRLLVSSGLMLVACAAAGAAMSRQPFSGNRLIFSILVALLVSTALAAAWGVLIGATRLRRSGDRFVVHRRGFARHHGGLATRTRWVDIAAVHHIGPHGGSKLTAWNGRAYVCRIERRDGSSTTIDNYVVDAVRLGREIEQRSLL